ncbi:alpha/beta-Hydrolases superfamily protein [Striga asiatica]|uniref:Alpha/beta-Hydrolases superfamily protein n=1 Tax=Striga asiatica TaxID=4170 RepID=A0A5A7RCQ2_STRAF|nr:alpha/beta-Hydrolases superfamily protein [Striga asiatica]
MEKEIQISSLFFSEFRRCSQISLSIRFLLLSIHSSSRARLFHSPLPLLPSSIRRRSAAGLNSLALRPEAVFQRCSVPVTRGGFFLGLSPEPNRVVDEAECEVFGPGILRFWTQVGRRGGSSVSCLLNQISLYSFDFVLLRPSGAPRAVIALHGTLLKGPSIRRDIEDELRFFTWESLKGSVRFERALKALKEVFRRYGSNNVCVVGHSLGAGFALYVGKKGVCVEAHLFNPPSISLASGVRAVGEKAGKAWRKVRSMLQTGGNENESRSCDEVVGQAKKKKWVPHLYVNNNDYICCYYSDPVVETKGIDGSGEDNENDVKAATAVEAEAKLFVLSRGISWPRESMRIFGGTRPGSEV